ncbi:unnamed protein product [Microthlaspi erraticum]|uniref:Uncharacterized protein n=1 Tax=Microthlaspi erraticum TaxID=1685480 RepID=A0A6D2HK18_9BRAS|nr:unnamed protein product [Microthlaspi erraticum]
MHLLNGLSSKFDNILNVIKHRSPACTFSEARSMLKDEEARLSTKRQVSSPSHDNASSPQILMASSAPAPTHTPRPNHNSAPPYPPNYPSSYGNRNARGNRGGRNQRGRGGANWQGGNWNNGPSQMSWNNGPSPPWAWSNNPPWPMSPPWQNQPQWPNPWSMPPAWPAYPPAPATSSQQPSFGLLGNNPRTAYLSTHNPAAVAQAPPPAPNSELIPTTLAHAFNTNTLSDPTDAG